MNRILRFLRGELRLRLTGASPEDCLNRFAREGVEFWGIRRIDALHMELSVLKKDKKAALRLAERSFCTAEILSEHGLIALLSPLRKRPILAIGMPLAVTLSFFLQSFVWTIEVEGAEQVHEQQILHELEKLGIDFGAYAPDIDSQKTKMQMLNAIPELSWLAVNRTGGKLTVLVTERDFAQTNKPPYPAGSLVAATDGIITDYTILEGMRLCSRGDTVKQGQVLVSGYEDYGLCLRAVCADGEIYAQTWHQGTLVMPETVNVKHYTGRQWTQITLCIGRKRINLYGNSRISTDTCDKMVNRKEIKLSGYALPLTLETATYREYELTAVQTDERSAQEQLTKRWEQLTKEAMVAGKIEETETALLRSGGLYILRADSTCTEMIARLIPIYEPYKGESYE